MLLFKGSSRPSSEFTVVISWLSVHMRHNVKGFIIYLAALLHCVSANKTLASGQLQCITTPNKNLPSVHHYGTECARLRCSVALRVRFPKYHPNVCCDIFVKAGNVSSELVFRVCDTMRADSLNWTHSSEWRKHDSVTAPGIDRNTASCRLDVWITAAMVSWFGL